MADIKKDGYISYDIKIGGKKYASTGPFLNISSYCEINRIPTANLIIQDGNPNLQTFELSSEIDLNPGKEIEVSLGYKGANKLIFKGLIIRHRIKSSSVFGSFLQIECKHAISRMAVGNKVRHFEQKDDKSILTELVKDSKIKDVVSFSGKFIKNECFLQFNISDWDFLLKRCEANSKVVLFEVDKVKIEEPKLTGSPVNTYIYGHDIIEFESEVDASEQLQKVESHTWDSSTQKVVTSVGKPSGFKQLENKGIKLDELKKIIAPTSYEMFHGGELEKAELDGWAKSKLTKASLSKVTGRIKIVGDNNLKLGDIIELKGLGTKFSGKVYVSAISQDYGEGGWTTNIQFGLKSNLFSGNSIANPVSAAGGLTSGVNGLQIGKVIKIDGDDQYRVQISLPIAGKKVKLWARMAFDDAGSKRGNIYWPEKDDEVVVGFLNDDPRNPIIIGSLFSKKNAPPIKAEAKNSEKGIVTKSDIRITFNDEDKSVEIKTPGGNSVKIDDKKKSINLEDQNKNVVILDKSGINLNSKGDITLNATKKIILKSKMDLSIEGMNIAAKAKVKFGAEGNSGAELKTPAIAIIKGSIVKIN